MAMAIVRTGLKCSHILNVQLCHLVLSAKLFSTGSSDKTSAKVPEDNKYDTGTAASD